MKEVSNSIRQLRRAQDFSQEYMAFELGISQKAYSDIETGNTRLKNETLQKIAKILGVRPSDICPISQSCEYSERWKELHKKHTELITYLKGNSISFPENLI